MASLRRLEKINNLLREETSRILDREFEFPEDILVTVSRIVLSPDVQYAVIHVSIFGGDSGVALEILQKNVYHIQHLLNRRLRMRPVPKIEFSVDKEEERRETVEQSLAELKRKKEL